MSSSQPWKTVCIVCLLLLFGLMALAQAPPQYGQYLFNGLVMNPAYTGNREALSISALYRNQWTGIPAAPRTLTLSGHTPLRNSKNNFGLMFVHDEIGISRSQWATASYAFRFQTDKKGKLALGLQGGVCMHRFQLNTVYTDQGGDPVFAENTPLFIVPRFGFGAWYQRPRFFAGFSVPELIVVENEDFKQYLNEPIDYRSYFLTAGTLLPLNPDLKLKPFFLLKYKKSLAAQADLSALLIYRDRFGFGGSYRTGDAVLGWLEFYPIPQWRIGYAYEYGLNGLGSWNTGTHELMVSYEFGYSLRTSGPRYF